MVIIKGAREGRDRTAQHMACTRRDPMMLHI